VSVVPGEPRSGSIAAVGAGGFLGSALVAAANRAGAPVDAYTRAVPAVLPDGRPDARLARAGTVFWLATSVNPALAETHPERVRADLATFVATLRALRGLPRPPRVALLSSGGAVYDTTLQPPYLEGSPTRPRGAYGRAKLAMEAALAESGLPAGHAVSLRVSNLYGPGQPAVSGQGVVGYWLRAAANGDHLTVYGDPGTTRDYVYVDDVADALLAVHAALDLPPVLNLGAGRGTSLGELADRLLGIVADPALRLELRPARGFDVPHSWLDVRLAETVLGWTARTDLGDGLARCWRPVPVPQP
jgi:UDP-glucose 4-epimerase